MKWIKIILVIIFILLYIVIIDKVIKSERRIANIEKTISKFEERIKIE